MSKITVISDLHGNPIWEKIVNSELDSDKFIFLGDYLDSKYYSIEEQISNLKKILEFKFKYPEKVELLRGNHDAAYIYGKKDNTAYDSFVRKNNYDLILKLKENSNWIYIYDDIIFSHAGISKDWLSDDKLEYVNEWDCIFRFEFSSNTLGDIYGTSSIQPPTWIRPTTLLKCGIPNYTQVVGHTPVKNIISSLKNNTELDIWFTDCLAINPEYLIIDNKEFKIKNLKNGSICSK